MAKLALYNEFGDNNTLLAIEPASKCAAHCSYCFAELNRRKQWGTSKRNLEDPGTFESAIERATGPNYDPTNIVEWAIVNKIPVSYANTVEPFQDVAQGIGILKTCDQLDIPLFIQTKGVNFDEVWPTLRAIRDNATLLVSMGSDDDRFIKRFEPGTPLSADRWRIIRTASEAGMDVILGMSPYHPEWCKDPVAMVRKAKAYGVESIFFDHITLNRRQREAATDKEMLRIATQEWDAETYRHIEAIWLECMDQGLPYTSNGGDAITTGCYMTRDTSARPEAYSRGNHWPYYSRSFKLAIEWVYEQDREDGPIVAYWKDIIGWIEREVSYDQVFSRVSMSELMEYNKLSPAWKRTLGEYAPVREYLRAIYNSGRIVFAWAHPYMRIAMRPDGKPWLDDDGNLVAIYDPINHVGRGDKLVVEDLDAFRVFSFDKIEEGVSS